METILIKLGNNHFIDDLRQKLVFNQDAYDELLEILNEIQRHTAGQK